MEATSRIVADHPATRVLVLSAHEDPDHVISLLEAGATSYLHKTISLNEFLEAIRSTHQGESILPPSVASVVVKYLSGGLEQADTEKITQRELEVLGLVAEGLTNDQIAQRLRLSKRTVEAHLTHIYNKLNVCFRRFSCAGY